MYIAGRNQCNSNQVASVASVDTATSANASSRSRDEGKSAANSASRNVSGTASAVLDDSDVPSLSHLLVSSMPNEADKGAILDVPSPLSTPGEPEGLADEAVTVDLENEADTVVHGESLPSSSCILESQQQSAMQEVSSRGTDGSKPVDAERKQERVSQ